MKSLKELIKEQYPNEYIYYITHNFVQEERDTQAFKEWLKVKRQELYSFKNQAEIRTGKQIMLDELLEELK